MSNATGHQRKVGSDPTSSRRHLDGVLLLDKPSGLTSNAALQKAKRLYRAQKAGHTGTLDPLASGLLPLCFGEATKFAQRLLDASKGYLATIRFGMTTTTGDAEGEVRERRTVALSRAEVEAALGRFVGKLEQVPPMHSALKVDGRPLYRYARAGEEVAREPRTVVVHALDLVDWALPDATVAVTCGKGTYVRVLAEDIGRTLGCGAHLAALRRTATGGFRLEEAVTLARLDAMSDAERDALLRPVASLVADLPRLALDESAARRFGQGQAVAADRPDGEYAAFCGPRLLGLADVAAGCARPRRVMAPPPC
ncbi:MAG: tRNA pseudouridine(55) synthase TruB [Burkholderiales bacterium]|nr:tRNA pseudouridine(55) synthase TruB [Burkholderiales bacterium]